MIFLWQLIFDGQNPPKNICGEQILDARKQPEIASLVFQASLLPFPLFSLQVRSTCWSTNSKSCTHESKYPIISQMDKFQITTRKNHSLQRNRGNFKPPYKRKKWREIMYTKQTSTLNTSENFHFWQQFLLSHKL